MDWEATYKTSALCTASTRLREFQFKFLHRITATNSLLYKINISDSSLCSFCAESEETILHLYWECPITAEFRRELTDFLVACSVVPRLDSVNMKTFGGLKSYTDNQTTLLLSHCLLLARYHIYRSRLRGTKPSLCCFLKEVKENYAIEKEIAFQKEDQNNFHKKWNLLAAKF